MRTGRGPARAGRRQALACAVAVVALLAGCTTVRVTPTERSGVEQLLLVRSIERAIAVMDVRPLLGGPVALEVFALTGDQGFAREYARTLLQARGVVVVTGADPKPVRRLRLFADALAVDTADTLLGVPPIQLPVLAVPIPEIALFKWERAQGTAALQVYAFDAEGRFVERLPDARGTGRWNRFTLLIFVSFTVSDLDEPPPAPPEPSP